MNHVAESGNSDPVFLVGYSRSGTTWMNSVLRDYLDIGLVNEGQFILDFGKKYKPDTPVKNLDRLITALSQDEFFDLLYRVYSISIDWPRLRSTPQPVKYADIIKLILSEIAQKLDKQCIGSKSPGFGWGRRVLLGHFPNCRIIHLIRDGRDCALSHYERMWGRQNAYAAATNWQKHIRLIREKMQGSPAGYIEVHYEDLLRNPETEFNRLAAFVLEGSKTTHGAMDPDALGREFAATLEPADFEKRTSKWKRKMSSRDQSVFESVAGKTLADLGYEATGDVAPLPQSLCLLYRADDKARREFMHLASKILRVPYGGKKSTLRLKTPHGTNASS